MEIDPSSIYEDDPSVQIPDVNNISESIDGSSASFIWEGNDYALEFSYKLEVISLDGLYDTLNHLVDQPYFRWSNWNTLKSMVFPALDEGNYIFKARSRFDDTIQETPKETNPFEINAFIAPTLRIYPLHQTIQPNEVFDVYLYFENIDSVNLLQVDIHFDGYGWSNNPVEIRDSVQYLYDSLHCFTSNNIVNPFDFSTSAIGEGGLDITITQVYLDDHGIGLCGTGPFVRIPLRVLSTEGEIGIIISGVDFQHYNYETDEFNIISVTSYSGSVTVRGTGQ